MNEKRLKIIMLRLGSPEIINDSRVLREAEALTKIGDVHILEVANRHYSAKNTLQMGKISISFISLISKSLPCNSLTYYIKYVEYIFKVVWFILHSEADVIHAHDLWPLLPAWLASRLKRMTIIYDSHELYTEQDGMIWITRKVGALIERYLLKRVDAIIAANKSRAQIMYKEYGAPELPTVIMNIPEKTDVIQSNLLRDFVVEQGVVLDKKSKIVLYQGGLSASRGLEELIEAFQYLPEHVVLVLMGYGALQEKLEGIIISLKLNYRVFIHEPVPSNELHPYTCSADLGVVTYKNTCRNKYYCAPNKLFEYAMGGLVIVGADLPEIRKFITTYHIGALFNPEDPKSIANAIDLILTNQTNASAMKSNLQSMISDFTWDSEKKKLYNLYRKTSSVTFNQREATPIV